MHKFHMIVSYYIYKLLHQEAFDANEILRLFIQRSTDQRYKY